ncbi:hypothetical protein JTE90_014754 [Oedothorax gibbosus]|uniref:Phospholipid scramblase n=1 Tax=Oedothorax gibbosus TaxID=931172 RepID=A0AAV6USW0_9ARAC|nr:hypothetical protein JTE90_014754 [Oedothorax gibbosus]
MDSHLLSTSVSYGFANEDNTFQPESIRQRYSPLTYPEVLTKQPVDGEPLFVPVGIPICPPGLEYLTRVDQLLVHQKLEVLEIFLGCETRNKYLIKNSLGQIIYTATEDSDCCTRNCIGPLRPFSMRIEDNAGREVINLLRECRCQGCCCPCCLQEIEIYSPPGTLVGRVAEEWSIFNPKYRIENAAEDTIFQITGPFCVASCCSDVDFPVIAASGVKVGKITKQWSGLLREAFTDGDHFGITFPIDLDVTMKAVLLGALFLIDFNYFETKQNNK